MLQETIHSLSQECLISNDPETIGFDFASGEKWFYPENYPRRDYQFTIVQTALYSNTLVCLPTGLGKTFIAAVVMYNFWRWYPRGRVIFLAPTKPLVTQQIHACNKIMGIPNEQTVELTGAINQNKRQQAWMQKRVVFATPQTFQKDLQNNYVPYELIKCIIFDEAHKALGKHSYCEIIRILHKKTKFFRILALSATPGNKIDHVREVIQNLHISKLELRDDSSPDIIPYTNDRSMEKIIVSLSKEINDYKGRYISIMDRHVRILIHNKILQGNVTNISKGKIFMLRKQYEIGPKSVKNYGIVIKTLNILFTMYHAYDLLIKHGLRAFYNFYCNHSGKHWFEAELDLQLLLEDIKKYIGNLPEIQSLLDETTLNVGSIPDIIFGHEKFYKLCDLLMEHFHSFSQQKKSTRAIVFVEYRDIVNEIFVLLLQKSPLIRPKIFVGKAGLNQKQQLAALEDFRNNKVNVLISTSVGEEGLDVGEVDLIICFDISTSTPIRLVQRIGRTGRKRSGRVIVLLTEGKEEEMFQQALSKKNSLNNNVLQSSNIISSLYESSPRMVPTNIIPKCLPIFIRTQPKIPTIQSKKSKKLIERTPKNKIRYTIPSNDNHIDLSSNSKMDLKTRNHENTQSTIIKFLIDQRRQKLPYAYNYDSDSGILSEEFQITDNRINTVENPYTIIKPKDVKLLTSDGHALEFLTLCAIKKSEEEMLNNDIIKIDKTWISIYSPVDIFHDFNVPSLDALDCIKNLTFYRESVEDESKLSSNGSISSLFTEAQNDAQTNLKEQEEIQIVESIFFDEYPITESNYIKKSEKTSLNNENVEVFNPDFLNNCFTFDSKHCRSENFEKIDSNRRDNANLYNDFPTFERLKKSKYLYQETLEQANAFVEVDFQNILDEYTESEESESQILEEVNNFDNLLDEASSDGDIFDFIQDQHNITSVTNVPSNDTIIYSSNVTAKRNASNSPCCNSVKKKQRVSDIESSDSENTIIFGTPLKTKNMRLFFNFSNSTAKMIPENAYPDSEQDLFDDLDFETQFSFTKEKDKTSLENKKNDVSIENKKVEVSFYKEKDKLETIPFIDEISQINLSQKKIKNGNKKNRENVNKDEKLLLKELNLIETNTPLHDIKKQKKIENKQLTKDQKSDLQPLEKTNTMIINDLNLDDWNDDFDLISSVKNLSNEEQVKNSLSINLKSTTRISQKKESSSSWMSLDITRKTTNNKPKVVHNPKNLKVTSSSNKKLNFLENSNLMNLTSLSLSNEKSNFAGNLHNKHNRLNIRSVMQPKLRLLSLKKTFVDNVDKEKNNFVRLQSKVNKTLEIKTNKSTKANISRKNYNDKKNNLPSWRDYGKHEKSSTPQFRKCSSKNNMCNKENKTKSIANNFIANEAEVSSDDEMSEGSSGEEDKDLTGFITYTQEQSDTVDIKAYYLQTLNKSPIRAGAFIFKPLKNLVPDCQIYSQSPSQVDNSYVNDSFCVDNQTYADDDKGNNSSNNSMFENIEFNLENRRKIVRRKRLEFKYLKNDKNEKNRKRNLKNNTDTSTNSSEDETEILRKQVLEESILLKQLQS